MYVSATIGATRTATTRSPESESHHSNLKTLDGGGTRMLRRNGKYVHPIARGPSLSGMPDQRVPDTMLPLERNGQLTGR